MKKCRFSRKSIAFEVVKMCDFKNRRNDSMCIVNDFIKGCAHNCPDQKCLAYRSVMSELAEKYKEETK